MRLHFIHLNMNKTFSSIILGVLVLGGLIWVARPNSEKKIPPPLASVNKTLMVLEANNYDFGTISMAAGKVKHEFKIKNTGTSPVNIEKIYTSCMCTTATLAFGAQSFGPYGMPGHGMIPRIDQTLDSLAEATIEVVFDPAAHGPAGIGRIKRVVTVENGAGQPLELEFAATVTP